eukprot:TRINITY_DN14372_c1_g1_i3.p1 TRINITY_DN14372_c1_g1~~TRINITY_DN14372_c1_g1_i3.p1  ORF type:complete len:178 (-),score=32.12 TRINITY_DN14372_c1_g1_i3:160-693(-)
MQWIGHWSCRLALSVLLAIELVADAIPAVDNALHLLFTPLYPIAGALVAAAQQQSGSTLMQIIMALLGGALAFSAHSGKAAFRATSTVAMGGLCNSCMSLGGTVGAILAVLLSLFVAVLAVILAMGAVTAIGYTNYTARKLTEGGQAASPSASPPPLPQGAAVGKDSTHVIVAVDSI